MGDFTASKNRFHLLDAIRGIAATLVVCRHTDILGSLPIPVTYMAVDVFFLLSGVVIASSYERNLTAGMGPLRFTWIRIARIYPLYILGSLVTVAAFLLAPSHNLFLGLHPWIINHFAIRWVFAMLLLPAPFGVPAMFAFDHPAWSLFFELTVNIFYAVIVKLLTTQRLVGLIAACAVGLIASLIYFHHSHLIEFGWEGSKTFLPGFFRAGFSFFLGVWLYRLRGMRWLQFFGRHSAITAIGILGAVTATLMANPPPRMEVYFYLFSVILVFPLLIWIALAVEIRGMFVPISDFLGEISYAIYALHVPVFMFFSSVIAVRLDEKWASHWLIRAAFFAVLLTLSYVLDKTYDKAARKFLRELWRSRASRPDGAAEEVGDLADQKL